MTTLTNVPSLFESRGRATSAVCPESLLDELRDLALSFDDRSARSRQLFTQLRKMLGQDRLTRCLVGIQHLAACSEPAGARLLAAFLDAQTPGAQLMPRVRRFQSVHRLLAGDPELVGTAFLDDWQDRLTTLVEALDARFRRPQDAVENPVPLDRPPLPTLRHALDSLMPRSQDSLAALTGDDAGLLAEMVQLEADAYQERVSRLAGTIDPYRITAVIRALPLLNRADGEIRDLGQLARWLEAGDMESAFVRRIPREFEILDEGERLHLAQALAGDERLQPLAELHLAHVASPGELRHLSGPVACLLALGRALQRRGCGDEGVGLLTAVSLVLTRSREGRFTLELPPELAGPVGEILMAARGAEAAWLRGLDLSANVLSVVEPRLGLGDRVWRHDLPTPEEMQLDGEPDSADEGKDDEKPDEADTGAFAIKQMVLNNVGSVSILLGFLRNQKITSIPGLVADVARRTRAGRVLEVIASDRNLYTGHANKDVPLALLESPVNVSVKMLRRFIHVKYISKTDLRRMANDTARLRKEVCREIQGYLDSLG